MKPNRQAKILELIETKDIETQEQLLQSGFDQPFLCGQTDSPLHRARVRGTSFRRRDRD